MRKQSLQLQAQISTGMLNDFTSMGGGSQMTLNKPLGEGPAGRNTLTAPGPTKTSKITAPTIAQNRSKVRKPHVSRSGQAMQPGSSQKKNKQPRVGKQMSANYASNSSKLF